MMISFTWIIAYLCSGDYRDNIIVICKQFFEKIIINLALYNNSLYCVVDLNILRRLSEIYF